MPKIIVKMDPAANGDQELTDIIDTIRAQGKECNAANVIRDAEGKVVQVEVNHPDTASDVARAAVDSNPGKAWSSVVIPDKLFMFDLTNIELATLGVDSGMNTSVQGRETDAPGASQTLFGRLMDGAAYTDYATNTLGHMYTIVGIHSGLIGGEDPIQVPPDEVTLSFDGGSQVLHNIKPLDLVYMPTGIDLYVFYVDTAGNLYLAMREQGYNMVIPWRSYAEAVAAGAY